MLDNKIVQKNTIKKELQSGNNVDCHVFYTNQPLPYKFPSVLSLYTGIEFFSVNSPMKNKKLVLAKLEPKHLCQIEDIIDTLRDFKSKTPELNMEIKLFTDKKNEEEFETTDIFGFSAEELGFVKRVSYKYNNWNLILQDISEYNILQKKDFLHLFIEWYKIKNIEIKKLGEYILTFELSKNKKQIKCLDFIIIYEQDNKYFTENMDEIDKDNLILVQNLSILNEIKFNDWWKILFFIKLQKNQ